MEHIDCNSLMNICNLKNVDPATLKLPYPPIKVLRKNKYYADLLSADYSSAVSEFTAIAQYVNHETRLTKWHCDVAITLLSIAMTEMEHLQIIGELILLLGGSLTYDTTYANTNVTWKTKYVEYEVTPQEMILADIEGEKAAIAQYKEHINVICDPYICAVLTRIVKDEEYHITLLKELSKYL